MSDTTAITERRVNHNVADAIEVGKAGINFQNAGELMEFARMMAASGSAVPKHLRGQPGACLGILDDAVRFNVNPYALGRASFFVNDQLCYSAVVFMALINARAPLKQRPAIVFDGDGHEMRATVTGVFRDGAVRTYTSPKIADISPRNSPLWKSDPQQQLSYYSLRAFARRWCPETILGVVDVDELREAAMTDITPKAEAPKLPPRSLDDFAAGSSSPSSALEGESAAGRPEPTAEPAPAGASDTAPAGSASRMDIVRRVMTLVGDDNLAAEEKLETLDSLAPVYQETQPKEFIDALLSTAAKVIRGELKPAAAKKYLEALK